LFSSPTSLLKRTTITAHDRGGSGGTFVGDQTSTDSAEESDSATHTSTSTTSIKADTTTSSTSSSFASFSSSSDDDEEDDEEQDGEEEEDTETRLDKLGMRHTFLGDQLSQLLRDKAAAENIKKRLTDGLLRAKARMKAIEEKLGE
jgi:molecular chaperone GrpE (heat shock protein)